MTPTESVLIGKSSCCGAPTESWNDGTTRCSACGKQQGR